MDLNLDRALDSQVDPLSEGPPGPRPWFLDLLSTQASSTFGFGFGGARVIELEKLWDACHPGDTVFFGVDLELHRKFGSPNPGAAAFVRENTACMMPWTQTHTTSCFDIGLVLTDDPRKAIQATYGISESLARGHLRPGLIACDHTASMICAIATAKGVQRTPVYLYFDAHFDLGLHHKTSSIHNGNFVHSLLHSGDIAQVVNVGARSWSTWAKVYEDVPGFSHVPGGMPRLGPEEIIARLAWLHGRPVYVSIDADILDPSCAPNVACPEPFGMSLPDLLAVCEWIGRSCAVIGADLCEITPSERSLGSEQALVRCLLALLASLHRDLG